jgi:hypothetical protein
LLLNVHSSPVRLGRSGREMAPQSAAVYAGSSKPTGDSGK